MATFASIPKNSRTILPKLKIPANQFEQELTSTVWVPNPETTKFKSLFTAASSTSVTGAEDASSSTSTPAVSTNTMSRSSIYCSHCKAYYITPTMFYNHINTCSNSTSTSTTATTTATGTITGTGTMII
ncbi:hypothetical protein LPJ73_001756 [Coemansia sp. RSA 2703]|nr:hypothetical protein LPJ73_001756 [Coemansia sp. RSA 2703]KAJ2369920.1 hypothetical protein IW150_005039 [Coemansia sp. RSA 2607]KAJ2391777.1 hypothetical protein GGI05_002851 [Coemansia sp. RSA 2603]